MRTSIVLFCLASLLTGSAYAGDKQATRANVEKTTVAAVTVDQVPAVRLTAAPTSKAKKVSPSDSRLDNYRLERESCCGPM